MKLFKRTKELFVEFCDRCGSVCTSACKRSAIIGSARDRALRIGGRL
jgi:hypothetical protein